MTEENAAVVWAIGIILWIIIRLPYRSKAKRTEVVVDKKSAAEKLALGLCILGLVLIPALHLLTNIFQFANYNFQPSMAIAGTLAMIGFLLFFYFSHKHLARNWSVTLEIRKDHKLIQNGVYKYIRHPMYTSFWLWGDAQFLLIPNWIAGLAGLISVAWLYYNRIEKEEAMMRSEFGDEYLEYCSKTNRLFPKIF